MNRTSVRPIVTKPIALKRSAPARRRYFALRVKPILGGVFLLAMATGVFVGLSYLRPSALRTSQPNAMADVHSGSIIISSADRHTCRRLKFDNVTGSIKDQGIGQCEDTGVPGAAERLGQVSNSFQGR